MDELIDIGILARIDFLGHPLPDEFALIEHRDMGRDLGGRDLVMRDGQRGEAKLARSVDV